MKLYMEAIEVMLSDDLPAAVRWRRRRYRVQRVLERWTYRGRWWTDPHALEGERRVYYRVLCNPWQSARHGDSTQLEIFRQWGAPEATGVASARRREVVAPWMLSRAFD